MNRFTDMEKQIKYIEVKGVLTEISDVAGKVRLIAGYDRLMRMQEEISYLHELIHNVEVKIDSLIAEKEKEKEEDEIYY